MEKTELIKNLKRCQKFTFTSTPGHEYHFDYYDEQIGVIVFIPVNSTLMFRCTLSDDHIVYTI